jgi:hypothetical protein
VRRERAELVTVCKVSLLPERLSASAFEAHNNNNNNNNSRVGRRKHKQNPKELNNLTVIETQQRTLALKHSKQSFVAI